MDRSTNNPKRMNRNRFFSRLCTSLGATCLFCLSLLSSEVAQAQPFQGDEARSDNFFSQPAGISRKEAARRARDATDGKVIAVKPDKKGGDGYNVRLVVEGGRVVTVKVDQSGKVHR